MLSFVFDHLWTPTLYGDILEGAVAQVESPLDPDMNNGNTALIGQARWVYVSRMPDGHDTITLYPATAYCPGFCLY
jgi:hypothetical protein